MHYGLIDLLGLAGTLVTASISVPQLLVVLRHKHDLASLRGISAGTNILLIANSLIWIAYGLLAGAYWTAIQAVPVIPMAATILFFVLRRDRELGKAGALQAAAAAS